MTNSKPLRDYMAARELHRIAPLVAFHVPADKKHKLNQHATVYEFEDGSRLLINHSRSRASCWHTAWKGSAADVHLGPIENYPVRVNARGA